MHSPSKAWFRLAAVVVALALTTPAIAVGATQDGGKVLRIHLEPVDGTTLTSLTKDNASHPQLVIFGGWGQDYPDPQNWLSVFWRCDASFAQNRGYCNEEFDRLTELGDTTIDPEERIDYYEQAGELLIADQPGPFAFHIAGVFVVKPTVTGYTPSPVDSERPGQFSSLMTIDKSG